MLVKFRGGPKDGQEKEYNGDIPYWHTYLEVPPEFNEYCSKFGFINTRFVNVVYEFDYKNGEFVYVETVGEIPFVEMAKKAREAKMAYELETK